MMKRRTFFKWGALLTATGVSSPLKAIEQSEETFFVAQPKGPLVISTWNFGEAANESAWEVLKEGGSSLDAVEMAARTVESDHSNRSVGIGGLPDEDGEVTLDACIMNYDGNCGSVAFLTGYEHPVSVARRIMEKTKHVMLVGEGAEDFAKDEGFDRAKSPREVKEAYKKWKKEQRKELREPEANHENHDTIGILALDMDGRLAGACTTSGWAYKKHGRVGDSPIIGAGLFVDERAGAACATGLGEEILKIAGSHTVVELMRQGMHPAKACEEAVKRILVRHEKVTPALQCCFIAMNPQGLYGGYAIQDGFRYAIKSADETRTADAPFYTKI